MESKTEAGVDSSIAVIVLAKNEEHNIQKCLASLTRFSQVFVVDSLSDDGTRELARRAGATLVDFKWNGEYPKKKQWALENVAPNVEWVLYVDADEEVPDDLASEIEDVVSQDGGHAGYFVGLDYVFLGKRLLRGQRMYKLVLFRRSRGRFLARDDLDVSRMWEVEGHYQPQIDGTVGKLRARLVHDDQSSLYEFFARHNRYSDWEAQLARKPSNQTVTEARLPLRGPAKAVFARIPLRAFLIFLYSFGWKRGFLDGRAGFHFAVAKAFYYWQIGVKRRELESREGQGSARAEGVQAQ